MEELAVSQSEFRSQEILQELQMESAPRNRGRKMTEERERERETWLGNSFSRLSRPSDVMDNDGNVFDALLM